MSDFPSLTELGIQNPQEITSYKLTQSSKHDILRIRYNRKKGSFLPTNKRFHFGRAEKYIMTDSGRREGKTVAEISPFVQKVVSELDQLVRSKAAATIEAKINAAQEIKQLRSDLNSRIEELDARLKQLESKA